MFRFLKNKLFPNKSKTRLKAYHSIPQLLRLEDRLTPVTGTFAGLPSTLYGPMSVAELNFSSIVTGVDISDFELFKDSTPVSLASAILSGSASGGSTYRLANLELLTASPGSYTLQLKASATSIIDQASNPLSGQPSLSWTKASSSISASNDNPTTTANTSTTLTPLANDSNSDGSGLRVYSATTINPSQASLTQNPDGSFTFLSNADGSFNFNYTTTGQQSKYSALNHTNNFNYGFSHVNAQNADEYLIETTGMKKYSEWQSPPITYWGPSTNGTEGKLVYKFNFSSPTNSIRLKANSPSWDFYNEPGGTGRGASSLEVSKDGVNWVSLRNSLEPRQWGLDWNYDGLLPSSVLGASNLWVRMRFLTEGVGSSLYTVAQFGRSTSAATSNVFEIQASLGPTGLTSDAGINDNFGQSVAYSNDTIVVGSHLDDIGSNSDQGSAYVFKRSGSEWVFEQKLTAPDGASGDHFGNSVSISGNTVVISSHQDDLGAVEQGSVYVFVRSDGIWTLQQKLTASDGGYGHYFGEDVVISGDVIVANSPVPNYTYIFTRTGSTWVQTQKLTYSEIADSCHSLAIQGNILAVGTIYSEPFDYSGKVYIWEYNGSSWVQSTIISLSDSAGTGRFGNSLSVSGNTIAIGASLWNETGVVDKGATYIYTKNGSTWTQEAKIVASDGLAGDKFGSSLSLLGDTLIIGSPGADLSNSNQGSTYIFKRTGSLWSEVAKFSDTSGSPNDAFGSAVALAGDTFVATSPGDDIAYTNQGSLISQNLNLAAATVNILVDSNPPTITISSNQPQIKSGETAVVSFVLSEPSANFDVSDITVSGGSLSGFSGTGTSYTATFTPTSNSTASGVIQVLSNLFTDSVGNNNLAGVPLILNVDTELPTVTITSNRSSLKFGETASVSFVLSEPSANFDVSDITVSGGSLSGFSGTGTSYTATFTPTSNSTASGVIQVLSNLFTDSVGNNNLAGVPLILNVDTELPTVMITSNRSSLKFGETAGVSFVLSEPSANFDVSDITVSGGSLSGFSGTGTSYIATFTPTSNSTASGVIQVLANKFSDAANNNNTASIPLSLTVDTILPTAAFANVNPSTREGLTQIAITFNESVTGFDTGDIQLTRNGVPVNLQGAILQGTGSSYVLGNLATITYPVGEYALQIKSNGTGIVDGVGNAFSSSNTVTWKMVGTDNTLISIRSPRKDGSMEIRDASTNQSLGTFTPFPGYSGAVHLVEGKFTGDGRRWVVMAAGEGGAPHIVMMDPSTGQVTRSWFGYSTFFRGGLFIGVGDVNGDGADDLVTGPNAGGGPHIKVYDGKTNQVIYEFMAYAPTFTGGVSVSLADVNGDGRLDIVTGTGKGGGPHVIAFDGMSGRQILSFMAYNPAFRGGVFVAAGDIDGDGIAEIVTGTGVGGGPHVGIFDSRTLQMTRGFFAYDSNFRGGVRVGLSDRNGDGVLDILTGPGPGGGPQVNVFDGVTLRLIDSFFAGSPDDLNGVYVN